MFRRIVVRLSSWSSSPKRIATWKKSVFFIGTLLAGCGWPERVANQ
jgi:hypothetical protein